MGGTKRKKRPPVKPYRFLQKKPERYDCPICYRENEVTIVIRAGRKAEISCASCRHLLVMQLTGACTDELDAYHMWLDIVEEEEAQQTRERMATAERAGLDTTFLTEASFVSTMTLNRHIP